MDSALKGGAQNDALKGAAPNPPVLSKNETKFLFWGKGKEKAEERGYEMRRLKRNIHFITSDDG